jgi:hypothetical protein
VPLRPTFKQGLTFGIGGAVLAFFGCLGAIAGFSSSNSGGSQALGVVGSIGFVAGLIGALIGGVLLVIAIFKAIFKNRDGGA